VRKTVARLIGAGLVLALAAPVWAHHSFAAYDMSKTVSQAGTIKEFRWGAPHASVVLVYTDKSGKPVTMSIVTGSPTAFSRQGFKPRDFRKGDAATVVYHPNVNGVPGGAMATLTLADGRKYSDSEAGAAGVVPGAPAGAGPGGTPGGAPRP
jgi:hypothetical protein